LVKKDYFYFMGKDSLFEQLKQLATVFDETSAERKARLLEECSKQRVSGLKEIRQYHDTLLFLLSYPENEIQFALAQKELRRLTDTVKHLPSRKKEALDRSGIAFTATQGAYSFSLIKWLLKTYPEQIEFHSLGEEGTHPKEFLKHVLPDMEFELASDEKLNPESWLKKAAGTKKKAKLLQWLIRHFDKLDCASNLKEQLFESLKVFVAINEPPLEFSRSFGKIASPKIYYHSKGILKRFDEHELIRTKFPSPKGLNAAGKNEIIKSARVALFLLNRETDPITYCNEEGLRYYELEHGLSIALFSMVPERRLPLESYIGFMMFKNGYPMSYGGAWIFGKRSLIGINIFEAFRGGESAFVFAQLMRTYHQVCGASYFEVEPYQFGKNNPEGIQSGAFWFYYRFGYRPLDKKLYELAQLESEKIRNTKGYRTPASTLKLFTHSNVAVNFFDSNTPLNPSEISKYISEQIVLQFKGNRSDAEKWALQKIKNEFAITEKIGTGKLALFIAFCLNAAQLSTSDKKKIKELIRKKEESEFEYIDLCRDIDFNKVIRLK
jgi:hypothetical protein